MHHRRILGAPGRSALPLLAALAIVGVIARRGVGAFRASAPPPSPVSVFRFAAAGDGRACPATVAPGVVQHRADLASPASDRLGIYPQYYDDGSSSASRRRALIGLAAAAAGTAFAHPAPPALAAQTAGEAVRRAASNIPGYGRSDVYYPPYFRGSWRATREVVISDDPVLASLSAAAASADGGGGGGTAAVLSYGVRFVAVDGGDDGDHMEAAVVADRGYNEREYRAAVRSSAVAGPPPPPAVRSAEWDASNPNVLMLSFADGTSEEIKVTMRATDVDPSGDAVFSSEYRRMTIVGERGIPSMKGSRILTKWRRVSNDVVEGIEIVYADTVMGDPMGGGKAMVPGGKGQQIVSSKSRIRLERL